MCQNCGRRGGPKGNSELHAHHIVPKSKGGTHKLSNLKTVCSECHKAIHGNRMAPSAQKRSSKYGSKKGHLWVLFLTGWWTFGLGNIVYGLYKRSTYSNRTTGGSPRPQNQYKDTGPDGTSETFSSRMEKWESKAEKWEKRAERIESKAEKWEESVEKKTKEYRILEYCPVCGKPSIEKRRVYLRLEIICHTCNAKLKEKFLVRAVFRQFRLIEGDSDRVGDTYNLKKWNEIADEKFAQKIDSQDSYNNPAEQ